MIGRKTVFTARCYASAVLAMALCLSVCPSVCPSQVGVLLKRLNVGSHKQRHTIVQGLWFSDAKDTYSDRVSVMTYTNWHPAQPNYHDQPQSCMNLMGDAATHFVPSVN